jgi:predicted NodU family carbamoyl transferase
MMMDSLVLTLGHNSSAILIRDNAIVAGFEEERLSGIKSDSKFPEQAIGQLIKLHGLIDPTIFVSHWELFGHVNAMNKKHWDQEYLQRTFGKPKIFETNDEFTHHDAHAWSAILFAEPFPCGIKDKSMIFVMDGFGTFGEHMSFYKYVDGIPHLVSRKFGFGTSLGLLYQYTTAFLGMKQNQDEYKLLAYEAHIDQMFPRINEKIFNDCIDVYTEKYITMLSSYQLIDKTDPMLNIGALPTYAAEVANMLSTVLKVVQDIGPEFTEKERRIIIAYFTQSIVERVVQSFIDLYNPRNIILVGGLFYNVKLNNMVSSSIYGKTCIMPLAGDQGAGLGLYKAMHSGFSWPGHLYWGTRSLTEDQFKGIDNLIYAGEAIEPLALEAIANGLKKGQIINVVRGDMEFGPRALCHTSTLAKPDPVIANEINRVNNRVNEMPFAPVMDQIQAELMLDDVESIHKSLEYMICTRDVKPDQVDNLKGASHRYPKSTRYSARPQITNDPFIGKLVHNLGPLINTSFNYHGVPIVYNADQIRHTHVMEQSHESENPPITVVIGE